MAYAKVLEYADAVKQLASWHRESDQPPAAIILFRDPEERVIRLLDVTDLAPESDEVYRFRFGQTAEIPYVTEVAQVTPSEWGKIQAGELALPEDWDLAASEEI